MEPNALIRQKLKTIIERPGTRNGERSIKVSVMQEALNCINEQDEQLKQVREAVQ